MSLLSVGKFEYNPANVLGNGAFAIVYEGRFKEKPDQKVAIKAMRGSDRNLVKSKNLLSKEIAVLKDLNHPNIVRLFDHMIAPDGVYLFMEYCNGGDLAKVLSERRTLSEENISSILSQLSSALDVMNLQGIMHRDLKPGNILLCYPPDVKVRKPSFDLIKSKVKYKLADFGFARFLQDGIMAVTMCGSPMYMAPEVLLCKNYTISVDIWSMGVIIYQCLTGVAPFQASNPEALKAIYQKQLDPIRFPPQTSKYLRDVIVKMLVKNPSNRISFKNIMQHPFVRGHITVDPPRKHSNFPTEQNLPAVRTNKPMLAEYFAPQPKSEAPPPPPYTNNEYNDTRINRAYSSSSNSSAIPIPTSTRQSNLTRNDEDIADTGFVFVNHDGSIAKESRVFAAIAQKVDRSENLLQRNSKTTPESESNNTIDNSKLLADSGHTSSNTGIYGISSTQKPFKLSTEDFYSKTDNLNQQTTFIKNSKDKKDNSTSNCTEFFLSQSPPSTSQVPVKTLRGIEPNHPVSEMHTVETEPNIRAKASFIQPSVQPSNTENINLLTRDRRSLTAPTQFNKLDDQNAELYDENALYDEPPELDDEVLCSSEHKEESQKIMIVLDMCELLFDLAEQRNALMSRPAPDDSEPSENRSDEDRQGLLDVISAPQRIAEQMLLYKRILQYLQTLFYEIKSAVEKQRLCATRTSCRNIRACNNLYHRCIIKLHLLIAETERNSNFGKLIMSWYLSVSVNKMIFHYSLDQCSAAEMDAIVGSLDMCTIRYKAAISLMLGLSQHAKSPSDVRDTKECINIMQSRFIRHWHAYTDSPTLME
uniref:Atg1 n=1 Tax=Dugesia japonica TaxID=6161 RepID=A0A2S1BJL0_DUGJA|nr:Atg1 [Dugesia japonica]